MTAPAFTILLPVHRPPAMLPFAIASVLAQDRRDFELFVICDGAPAETAACAREFAAADQRIRVFVHPKGERHGELYRDQALREARGEYVCQIGDDDLWLPNHLTEMVILLRDVDFGNLAPIRTNPNGMIVFERGSLGDRHIRRRILTRPYTPFGPTVAGYRLTAYRGLPIGWSPAPPEVPSDVYMWRKFLTRDGLKFGTRMVITSLKFEAVHRREWSMEERRAEVAAWAERVSTHAGRDAYTQLALLTLTDGAARLARNRDSLESSVVLWKTRAARHAAKVTAMRGTLSWRLARPFRALARLVKRRLRD